MPIELYYAIFLLCLSCIVAGSIWLDEGLDRLGNTVNLLPGILGLISALGADSPEISSSISAMLAGSHDTSVGVMIGSNLFNLAGLMGFSAILAGRLRLHRSVTAFNGVISLLATGIVALLVLHVLSPILSISLLGGTLLFYSLALSIRAQSITTLALPVGLSHLLSEFLRATHEHHARNPDRRSKASVRKSYSRWRLTGIIAGSLLVIVLGSYGIVHVGLRIGHRYGIADSLIGSLILAPLTGFPNVYTSARLALRGRGAAMISETLNSNTINMVIGIGVPAVFFGINQTVVGLFELWWLLGLTGFALALTILGRAVTRPMGGAIIFVYLCFIAARLYMF